MEPVHQPGIFFVNERCALDILSLRVTHALRPFIHTLKLSRTRHERDLFHEIREAQTFTSSLTLGIRKGEFCSAVFCGPKTMHTDTKDPLDFVSLRITFYPGGFFAFSSRSVEDLVDQKFELQGNLSASDWNLHCDLSGCDSFQRFEGRVNSFLLKRVLPARSFSNSFLQFQAFYEWVRSHPFSSYRDYCDLASVSPATLNRVCKAVVGIPPRNIIALQRAYSCMTAFTYGDLSSVTGVAHHFEYADASHFYRRSKQFFGENPQFIKEVNLSREFSEDNVDLAQELFLGTFPVKEP